ncbi:MAG: LUD domain-containing protein [Candidatus Krumholzibacteria bacterium]|jgi:L-lactate dehydrogenase complex protein LldG|nr:LUD domain-containing protein [Candidatus Krumholzibacteria bacterium]MDP6668476.1 LUD domain-containing protein [Candidatus Krumholzibacteria bacterium]MDP6797370.1 LUD domain-containing protein [Candidatus Krumholzibacteria bacterium]MDP7021569.1 LUD domain-containing protein [Candidatus Krumholzibacteria bacterium]
MNRELLQRFEENAIQFRELESREEILDFAGGREAVREGEISFTLAEAVIMETGSLVLGSRFPGARRAAFLAEEHRALFPRENCFENLADYLKKRGVPPGDLTLITGPSRTADIEKVLVLGAHGPRRLLLASAAGELIEEVFGVKP